MSLIREVHGHVSESGTLHARQVRADVATTSHLKAPGQTDIVSVGGTILAAFVAPSRVATVARQIRFQGGDALQVHPVPPGQPLSSFYVNINQGVLTDENGTPVPYEPRYTLGPAAIVANNGIRVSNTPGDEHIIIEKKGVYAIQITGRLEQFGGVFVSTDFDIGLSITPPGVTPTSPLLDGMASGTSFGTLIPTPIQGSVLGLVTHDNTRIDLWTKAERIGGSGTVEMGFDQNLIFSIYRTGSIPPT